MCRPDNRKVRPTPLSVAITSTAPAGVVIRTVATGSSVASSNSNAMVSADHINHLRYQLSKFKIPKFQDLSLYIHSFTVRLAAALSTR
jgi:hypothetical protein